MVAKISPVFILISEGFVDAFGDGLAVEDEAFCDRRLWIKVQTFIQIFLANNTKFFHVFSQETCNKT